MSSTGPGGRRLERPEKTLPEALAKAAAIVARDQGLRPDWLNTEVAAQWSTGFPPGMAGRITWRQLGALEVGLIARLDLIFFKVYAATGTTKPDEKHYQDLIRLNPSQDELAAAESWTATQGAGVGFEQELQQLIANVRRALGYDGR
jgi:hypothetical protein